MRCGHSGYVRHLYLKCTACGSGDGYIEGFDPRVSYTDDACLYAGDVSEKILCASCGPAETMKVMNIAMWCPVCEGDSGWL